MTKQKKKNANPTRLRKAGEVGLTAGKWLLEFLDVMLEMLPDPAEGRRGYMRRLEGWPKEVSRHRIHEEVKRAKDRGWIIEAEKQGKKFIKLTEKGQLTLLYRKLHSLGNTSKRKWGGTWWMALYDIPEKGRTERRAVCRALCAAGFKYLQKSVYVYPYELPQALIAYLKEAKLLPYIRFVHIDRMDGVRGIHKHFQLPRRPRKSRS